MPVNELLRVFCCHLRLPPSRLQPRGTSAGPRLLLGLANKLGKVDESRVRCCVVMAGCASPQSCMLASIAPTACVQRGTDSCSVQPASRRGNAGDASWPACAGRAPLDWASCVPSKHIAAHLHACRATTSTAACSAAACCASPPIRCAAGTPLCDAAPFEGHTVLQRSTAECFACMPLPLWLVSRAVRPLVLHTPRPVLGCSSLPGGKSGGGAAAREGGGSGPPGEGHWGARQAGDQGVLLSRNRHAWLGPTRVWRMGCTASK